MNEEFEMSIWIQHCSNFETVMIIVECNVSFVEFEDKRRIVVIVSICIVHLFYLSIYRIICAVCKENEIKL